jgi:large subunit ribosomal protein L35
MPGRRNPWKRNSEMPKMKTKSGAKKRFSMTASGKIKMAAAYKRHNMRKRPPKMIQHARGNEILNERDARVVRKWLPYGL